MELLAEKRDLTGSKVKSLRAEGKIPGVVFSKKTSQAGDKTLNLTIDLVEFQKVYEEAGESALVTVDVESEKRSVLISEVQIDPMSLVPIHVSFYEVDLSEKITTNIPIDFIGEEENEAVKSGEGLILPVINEIEVECLPNDIPGHFVIDVSKLTEVGDVLTVAQTIKVDESKVTILTDKEEAVVKLDYAEQLEVEEEERSVEDVEAITEKPVDEDGEEEESGKKKDEPASDDNEDDTSE